MRLKRLPLLFSLRRYRKLCDDFTDPWQAALASSGLLRRRFQLRTRHGGTLVTDRNDEIIWRHYFESNQCRVEIQAARFHIIPRNPRTPAYDIAGAEHGMTWKPSRWNPAAYRSALLKELEQAERRVFSQHGEDGVLEALTRKLTGLTPFIVEFGAYDGEQMSNSRNLIVQHGWSAYLIEAHPRQFRRLQRRYRDNQNVTTQQSFVTVDNINRLFAEASVPRDFGVLSIDVDSIDYYLWQALHDFAPRIVIIEYNSSIAPDTHYVVPMADAFRLGATCREGASLLAFYELGKQKGYTLIYSELFGANLFFVHNSCLPQLDYAELTPQELYQPPQFGLLAGGVAPNGRGYGE